jgi:DUF1009 family protein
MATGVVWQVVATIRRVCLRRRGKDYKDQSRPVGLTLKMPKAAQDIRTALPMTNAASASQMAREEDNGTRTEKARPIRERVNR